MSGRGHVLGRALQLISLIGITALILGGMASCTMLGFNYASLETGKSSQATVSLKVDGNSQTASATGNGAVDASFKAIESIVKSGSTLQLYSVNSITSGTDAQGEVGVRLERDGRIVNGHGADLDIVIASARAYVNALNKLYTQGERSHPQLSKAI